MGTLYPKPTILSQVLKNLESEDWIKVSIFYLESVNPGWWMWWKRDKTFSRWALKDIIYFSREVVSIPHSSPWKEVEYICLATSHVHFLLLNSSVRWVNSRLCSLAPQCLLESCLMLFAVPSYWNMVMKGRVRVHRSQV